MTTRIRVVAGCFGIGIAAMVASATAAQAAMLSGSHVTANAAVASQNGRGGSGGSGWSGNGQTSPNWTHHRAQTAGPAPTWTSTWAPGPTPTPMCTCRTSPAPAASTRPPLPRVATPTPTAIRTSVPVGGAQTGGGGGVTGGGSDVPLAVGGSFIALGAAGVGLLAFRRWRKTRLPVA
jgi:hypothetical protein